MLKTSLVSPKSVHQLNSSVALKVVSCMSFSSSDHYFLGSAHSWTTCVYIILSLKLSLRMGGFRMRLPHCVAIFYNSPWFWSIKVSN
jgi:hypothetical protein